MEPARNVMLAIASTMLVALAGCAATTTTRNTALADSAATLDRNAQALADHSDAMTPDLAQDAHALAQSTFHFYYAVGADGTATTDARTAFESVTRDLQKVTEDVSQADNANARADLKPVTEAYQDVQRAMGEHS
jgi:hypothetical protein